jgi:glycosyltransferase involved in cell wall biosynthesis
MLVTVYITTYNRQELLKKAIDSVLNQTYDAIEIIVADDDSNDGTQDYLQEQQSKGVLTAVLNTTNTSRGACYGRNKAIEMAKGVFITGLDDDDHFEPWRIQTFVTAWQSRASESFSALFDGVAEHRKTGIVNCFDTPVVKHKDLRMGNIVGNQVFTLTANLREINGFDEKMPALQDWDTWLRLSKAKGDIINVNARSYIQIHDHGGVRISEKPAAKIRFAFERLKSKLAPLTFAEECNLLHTMYSYDQMNNKLTEIVKVFISGHFRRVAQIVNRTWFK